MIKASITVSRVFGLTITMRQLMPSHILEEAHCVGLEQYISN